MNSSDKGTKFIVHNETLHLLFHPIRDIFNTIMLHHILFYYLCFTYYAF